MTSPNEFPGIDDWLEAAYEQRTEIPDDEPESFDSEDDDEDGGEILCW